MDIDGYEHNPYPFEIGDILLEKEDQSLAVLISASWADVHLVYLTSSLAGGVYTARTLNSVDEFEKVGHIGEQWIQLLVKESEG